MKLFGKKDPEPAVPPPAPWTPTVDLATARPVLFALASAPASTDAQVRQAIAELIHVSGRPSLLEAIELLKHEPDVVHRPWIWLAAAIREAAAAGDNEVAAALARPPLADV